jgi:hypothetical protein
MAVAAVWAITAIAGVTGGMAIVLSCSRVCRRRQLGAAGPGRDGVGGGGRRVEGGWWRMEDGGWRVEGGGWEVGGLG